jgi:hypothetical protein
MTSRARNRLLAFAAAAVLVAGVAGTVAASNFGPIGDCGDGYCCVCFANNRTHKMSYQLNTQFRRAMNWARTNVYNPTDVNTVNEVHGRDDVASYTNNYKDSGWYGIVDCVDYRNKKVCDHWHLHINTFYGPYTRHAARALACHELGHTLGLQHTTATGTCMRTANPANLPLKIRPHDRRHLNNRY